jgi:hypothetical protein
MCLKKAIPPAHMNPYFKMPEKHYFSFYFILLHYYKTYPTLQILGLQFGCSDKSAFEYLESIKPALKKALETDKRLAVEVFGSQAAFDKAFEGVKEIMIDGFEVPVERDKDKRLEAEDYSGKKNLIPR